MTDFPGPMGNRDYVDVGGYIEPLEPTPFLEWRTGQLYQWFVATHIDKAAGVTHQKGEWRPVPSQS